jgi:hypothetical protein
MKTEQIGAPEAHATDPRRTRTSEASMPRVMATRDGPDPPLPDEPAPSAPVRASGEMAVQMDSAAVSFERERERALARLDHTASIIRLRRALMVGLPVWMSAMLLDWLVTRVSGEGSLPTFLWLRGGTAVLLVGTTWRLWRQPEPSVPALWFYDILARSAHEPLRAAAIGARTSPDSTGARALRGALHGEGSARALRLDARGARGAERVSPQRERSPEKNTGPEGVASAPEPAATSCRVLSGARRSGSAAGSGAARRRCTRR